MRVEPLPAAGGAWGPDRTRAPADVPAAAAAAARLRAPSRSAGAALLRPVLRPVLRRVRPARSSAAGSAAAGTWRRGPRPHLLRWLRPGSRGRPARRDAARAGGVAREPGRRVPAAGRASAGPSPSLSWAERGA